ncbi:MAG: spermidine synthase [Acidobacteria bacterium]|nr:spermidine synthase [Acidobacteriota bacterium]
MKIEEIAYHRTELGELVLRRRIEPRLGDLEIFEVKLGDEFLMSSLFTNGEEELSALGLAGLAGGLDVVVGGLGLGYTAVAALRNEKVRSLLVIDKFQEVIDWHLNGLVPLGEVLAGDQRCELRAGDFFALARTGFDAADPERRFDAVLLDIDHSPEHYLDETNRSFYGTEGLNALRGQLKSEGVFALWSNDPSDGKFIDHLRFVFGEASGHDIEFANPYTNSVSVNSVYIARNRTQTPVLR